MAVGNRIWAVFLNEASSGSTPTTAEDYAAGTDVDLSITFGGGAWSSNSAGNGLTFAGASGGGAVSGDLASGNKVWDAFSGTNQMTLEFDFETPSGTPTSFTGPIIIWDAATGDSLFGFIYHSATGLYRFYFGDDTNRRTVSLSASTRYRIIAVFDSPNATTNSRVRLYVNGSSTGTVVTMPSQNQTIQASMPTNIAIGLGNYPDLTGQYQGRIFYAALYDGAFTDAEAAAHDAALATSNDVGAGSTTTSVSGSVTMSASVARTVNANESASVSMNATLARLLQVQESASVSMAGSVVRALSMGLSASATLTGSVVRSLSQAYSAAVSMTGSVARRVELPFSGGVTMSVSLAMIRAMVLSAMVTVTGTLSRRLSLARSVQVTITGSVRKLLPRSFSALVSVLGSYTTATPGRVVATMTLAMVARARSLTGAVSRRAVALAGKVWPRVLR